MDRNFPTVFRVTWTGRALETMLHLIRNTRHAENNPAWIEDKYVDCVFEVERRLELFPDLRVRYMVAGMKCGAMTLRALPLQVFFRQVAVNEVVVFECRWATLDTSGPGDYK